MNASKPSLVAPAAPDGVTTHPDYLIKARPTLPAAQAWTTLAPILAEFGSVELRTNSIRSRNACVASFDVNCPVDISVRFSGGEVTRAEILPSKYSIATEVKGRDTVHFTLDQPRDVMLILNDDKWTAVHFVVNQTDAQAPTADSDDIWYFGPGINNGTAYKHVVDGKLRVPSGKTVYLASGAYLTAGLHFRDVEAAGVRGHGFIYKAKATKFIMEKQGAILIENSSDISIEKVTSLSATGFSFLAAGSRDIRIDRHRSFSSCGNGDGLHFLSTSNVRISNCFLRNSDDTIAINCGRWEFEGNSENYVIDGCVLLADIAHPILVGTHGTVARPSVIQNIRIRNVDILDHCEHQLWYQGCIALNAGDGNLLQDIELSDVRVRRISKGQLFNIRVMQNARWTKGPGRGVRDVTIRNLSLVDDVAGQIYPSQILGYDSSRNVERLKFENLMVGGKVIRDDMERPKWYMVEDFVPVFVNEHVEALEFNV